VAGAFPLHRREGQGREAPQVVPDKVLGSCWICGRPSTAWQREVGPAHRLRGGYRPSEVAIIPYNILQPLFGIVGVLIALLTLTTSVQRWCGVRRGHEHGW
jgi:hypothetical protein